MSILLLAGCVSSGISGTYTSIENHSVSIVLHPDGTMDFRNGMDESPGNYTFNGDTLILTQIDGHGGTSALFTTLEPNGTFSIGRTTYKKTS